MTVMNLNEESSYRLEKMTNQRNTAVMISIENQLKMCLQHNWIQTHKSDPVSAPRQQRAVFYCENVGSSEMGCV